MPQSLSAVYIHLVFSNKADLLAKIQELFEGEAPKSGWEKD